MGLMRQNGLIELFSLADNIVKSSYSSFFSEALTGGNLVAIEYMPWAKHIGGTGSRQ